MAAAERKAFVLSFQRTMKALQQRASNILTFVTNFNIDEQDTLLLETRREAVAEMRSSFAETESKIYGLLKDEDVPPVEMLAEEFYDLLNEILYQITKKLKPLSTPPEPKPSLDSSLTLKPSSEPYIKLPVISLPKFSGHYEDWLYFRNQFNHIVRRNESLNDQQRLHYLRSCLSGEAASIETPEESFVSLWRALEARYENRRWLVDRHLAELFQIKPMLYESASALQSLINVVQKNLRALHSLKLTLDPLSEAMVVHVVASRLDKETHKDFESHVVGNNLVKWQEMADYLQTRCRVLESLEQDTKPSRVHPKPAGPKLQTKVLVTATRNDGKRNFACFHCGSSHYINECRKFLDLPEEERFDRVKALKLCINCFSNRHVVAGCSSGNCQKCGQRHNTLLHFRPKPFGAAPRTPLVPPKAIQNKIEPDQDRVGLCTLSSPVSTSEQTVPGPEAHYVDQDPNSSETSGPVTSQFRATEQNSPPRKVQLISTSGQALLHTAIVYVRGGNGEVHECRAVLDSCAMTSFMTTACAQRLRLKTFPANISIVGFGGAGQHVTEAAVTHVYSKSSLIQGLDVVVEFLVTPCIVNRLPLHSFDISNWNIPEWIDLADPHFNQSEKIDILFGIIEWDKMMMSRTYKLGDNLPTLRRTVFGWVAGGPVNEKLTYPTLHALPVTNEELDEQLTKFWEVESYSSERFLSAEEQAAEDHFVSTHRRDEKGRYVVALPFKEEEVKLGDSAHIAHRRFLMLESRLAKDHQLYDDYRKFMQEYIDLGHMEKIGTFTPEQQPSSCYFLPHHAVVRPESSTTKLRVVFDASAKSSNGQSLNDQLLVGPTLQPRLIDNLLSFRTYKVAVTSDIAKMFRQIDVRKEDRRFQQILWRSSPEEEIGIYQLTTVTYGTSCAPFLATRTLLQTCIDEAEEYPLASSFGKKSVYMDDVLFGAETVDEALEMQKQLAGMLGKAGFELHKWCSNRSELLAGLPQDKLEQKVLFNEEGKTKTLGITWQPEIDVFSFDIHSIAFSEGVPTKRKVLSDISKFFDPCGLAAPVVMTGKIYMQELWRGKWKWDEALKADLEKLWVEFRDQLSQMKSIRISRCVLPLPRTVFVELIGFCDASQKGYGAVLYLRSKNIEGQVAIRLLCSKSHVAPLKEKRAMIPRLEISGADKLAQLVDKVKRSLPIEFDRLTCYSDSTIALSWINTDPSKLEVYIANRVARIQTLINKSDWFHVRSGDNPADLVSRGIMPGELETAEIWWKGPPMMIKHERPAGVELIPEDQLPGLLAVTTVAVVTAERFLPFVNCSKYQIIVRVVARIQRWHQNCCKRSHEDRRTGEFNPEEIRLAKLTVVRLAQKECFPEVFNQLRKQVKPQNHSLIPLSPFVDNRGVLRVGGRLSKSSCSYDTKHQMILPQNHPLTLAIIRDKHKSNMHAGEQLTLAAIRREFWIIRGRSEVKRAIRNCVVCFKNKARPVNQYMGDLPACRLEGRYPFNQVGIDLCGPIYIKQRNKRSTVQHKSWIVLFICLSTKAIHLELVNELSTAAFLAAFDRFVSRRGRPAVVWTDNGTNFVGAANLLEDWDKFFASIEVQDGIQQAYSNEITWRFNPPDAPHFGGIWEANIRQTKNLLLKHTAGAALCFEEMSTVLARIEAILNSRPITPLSDDPEDFEPLTPGHFLVFRPLNAVARPAVDQSKHSRSRYEHITRIVQHFWDRWHFEYLTTLQQRYKWHHKIVVEVGQLVLIKKDNMPVQKWLLGRIIECFPGTDGFTRVVNVKTKDGILKRAVSKLCFLPIDPDHGFERQTFQRREDV